MVILFFITGFRTHSTLDSDGKRKNFGLSTLARHVENCRNKKSSSTTSSQPSIVQFSYNKRGIPDSAKTKLKIAEAKFVVSGSHSFLAVENHGLKELAATCINIGAEYGKVPISNIWYGRKTVQGTCILQKEEVTKKIKGILKKSIKNNEVSCTCDLWTDGASKLPGPNSILAI